MTHYVISDHLENICVLSRRNGGVSSVKSTFIPPTSFSRLKRVNCRQVLELKSLLRRLIKLETCRRRPVSRYWMDATASPPQLNASIATSSLSTVQVRWPQIVQRAPFSRYAIDICNLYSAQKGKLFASTLSVALRTFHIAWHPFSPTFRKLSKFAPITLKSKTFNNG